MESQGRDIKLDEQRVEGYRNFATKLWNAARFAQSNGIGASATLEPPAADLPVNRWIVAETVKTVQALDLALADLRFDEAANTIYQFVWATFCDWYLELIKPSARMRTTTTQPAVAGWVLDQILVMLHPFMPFITEELWHALGERALRPDPRQMADGRCPRDRSGRRRRRSTGWSGWSAPSAPRVPNSTCRPAPSCRCTSATHRPETLARLQRQAAPLARLGADRGDQRRSCAGRRRAANRPRRGDLSCLPLEGVVDLAAERARLARTIAATAKELAATTKKLDNPSFVERAKPEVVEENRERLVTFAAEIERLQAALSRLG